MELQKYRIKSDIAVYERSALSKVCLYLSTVTDNTRIIKSIALQLGFSYCGISTADFLPDEAKNLERWLKENRHGEMSYMENHFDMRLDPRKLVPGAKSVVSLMYNYFPEEKHQIISESDSKISKYAYGKDYHKVIRKKLKQFVAEIKLQIGDVEGRVFVDSAPVMEKAWAAKSGLGWVGKNTNLINKQSGSFFFLSELIIDLDLSPDGPIKDYCGTCTKCIDACPTDALRNPYQIDATKCISYLTIELKNQIPTEFAGKMDNWVYGCDVCQDVCPWNRFSIAHKEPKFTPSDELLQMDKTHWEELTEGVFDQLFEGSAVKRTKFVGLKRNIRFALFDPAKKQTPLK